jgi:hypothetical protein
MSEGVEPKETTTKKNKMEHVKGLSRVLTHYIRTYGYMSVFPHLVTPEPEKRNVVCPHGSLRVVSFDYMQAKYTRERKEEEEEQRCVICLCDFEQSDVLVRPHVCQHIFHHECLKTWLREKEQCPTCRLSLSFYMGPQPHPPGSFLHVTDLPFSLAHFPSITRTLQVRIFIPQERHHKGTYLRLLFPHNTEGEDLVRLIKLAYQRRLLFRIVNGKLQPNGIELKMYPDPTYFIRLRYDLEDVGVV